MSETTPDHKGGEPGRLFAGMTSDEDKRNIFDELDSLALTAARDLDVDAVMISVLQENRLHTLGAYPAMNENSEARTHVPEDTVCQRTIEKKAPLNVPDARREAALCELPYVKGGGIVGYLGVPVGTAAHGIVGSLCAITSSPKDWTAFEQKYLEQLARTVSYTLLAGMRLVEQKHLSEELTELDRIVATLAAELPVPTSVYNDEGSLAFANASLTALVPLEYVAEYQCKGRQDKTLASSDGRAGSGNAVDTFAVPGGSGEANTFRISCSKSASGMTVCHWFPNLGDMN